MKNLLDWEMKSTLNEEEREIALAFEEAFHKNGKNGISIDQILLHCTNQSSETLLKVLNGFVSLGYITSLPHGDKSQYNVVNN